MIFEKLEDEIEKLTDVTDLAANLITKIKDNLYSSGDEISEWDDFIDLKAALLEFGYEIR